MEVGKIYKIKFADGDGIVKLKEINDYSIMPSDYIFEYEPGSPQPLKHPDMENKFPLPEGLVDMLKASGDLTEVV